VTSVADDTARGPAPFWQVGIVVADIERSMAELTRALGVDWGPLVERELEGWRILVVFSREGPPYLELLQGSPGSPWDAAAGSRLDHLGYWTGDLAAERERLEGSGMPVVIDGEALGGHWNYHRLPETNMRVEPISAHYSEASREAYDLGDLGAMP
jgi:Glyoxalase/Bleomycin resistance protein/Dioxygenase superfamily